MILNGEQDAPEPGGFAGAGHDARTEGWHRGQTLAIVALMLVVLIGFLAVVIDLGNVYAQRRFMQNAADAGALAGARALALGQGDGVVYGAVDEYAKAKNGAQDCATTIEDRVVTVVASKTVGTFFASVVGVPRVDVLAVAAATYSPLDDVHGGMLMPLIISNNIWLDAIGSTHPITIWSGDPNPNYQYEPWDVFSGGRGWLNVTLGGQGSAYPKEVVCDMEGEDYPRELADDSWVPGSDGLDNAVLQRFDYCREGTDVIFPLFDDWCKAGSEQCNALGFLPSTDPTNHYYHICGFAVFHVDRVDWAANPKLIVGTFITSYIYTGGGPGSGEDPVTGPVGVYLVR